MTLLGTATEQCLTARTRSSRFAKCCNLYLIFFLVYNNVAVLLTSGVTMVFIVAGALLACSASTGA